MKQIEWNDELSVGVPKVDTQHKELIRIANVLLKAVTLGRDERVLGNVVRKLRDYTVHHFSNEEDLMETVGFPGRGEHANEHARLKREVKDYQRLIYKKENLTPDALLEFLKDWLLGHILTFDRDLARFIHEQEAQDTESETDVEIIGEASPEQA